LDTKRRRKSEKGREGKRPYVQFLWVRVSNLIMCRLLKKGKKRSRRVRKGEDGTNILHYLSVDRNYALSSGINRGQEKKVWS